MRGADFRSVPLPLFFPFFRKSDVDGGPACGRWASLALRSVFSTLQRLAPLQSHNSRLAALRQMTLRALRCDGRVPRKKPLFALREAPPPGPTFAGARPGVPRGAIRTPLWEQLAGCSKTTGCKAPEILSHESYPFRYVEWRRMRETPQTGVFQQLVRKRFRDGGRPRGSPRALMRSQRK